MKKMQSEIVLRDDELRAIGCVVLESTYLETLIDLLIKELCCLDERDYRLLIEGAQLKTKLDLLREITRARIKPEFIKQHERLFGDISAQIANRNRIIHGRWGVPHLRGMRGQNDEIVWERGGEAFAVRKARRAEKPHELFKIRHVMTTARALSRLSHELAYLLLKCGLWPAQFVRAARPSPVQAQTLVHPASQSVHQAPPPRVRE